MFVLPSGSWQDHAGLLLGVVGIFAFATGFLNAAGFLDGSGWGRAFPDDFLDNLTSPNLFDFVGANLRLLGVMQFFGIAFIYGRDPWSGWGLGWKFALFPFLLLYTILVTVFALLFVVGCFAYLILVVPFAYLAYAMVSSAAGPRSENRRKANDEPLRVESPEGGSSTTCSSSGCLVSGHSRPSLRSWLRRSLSTDT